MSGASGAVLTSGFAPPTGDDGSFLVSRADEAERIAAYVRNTSNRLVVLCGQSASGKTLLVRRWVIPALRQATAAEGYRVFLAECTSSLPPTVSGEDGEAALDDVMARKSIVVIDAFDGVFDAPREERRRELDALFEKINRSHPDTVVVLVVSVRHLTGVYALSAYDPAIASAVYQVKSIGLVDGLQELDRETPDAAAHLTAEVYRALNDEWRAFERRGLDVTFTLLRLLHSTFVRVRTAGGHAEIGSAQYKKLGGLAGILRDYIDRRVLQIQAPGAGRVARAILLRIREAQVRGGPPDLSEIASRLEVSGDELRAVMESLTAREGEAEGAGLLRWTPDAQLEFEPPQIVAIIDDDATARQPQLDRLVRIVEEGIRSWQSLGSYLPSVRFAEVHNQRRYLVLDDDLTRFVAQCALRLEEPELRGAARHWLRRVRARQDRIDILLSGSLDESEQVRERGVTLLRDCPDTLVRDRLCVLALTETSPSVRAASIDSLRNMADNDVLERVLVEVQNPNSTCREHAIDALAVFPRPDVSGVLQSIVDDADATVELRARAVSVLAALNLPESVDALVKIALDDPDAEDRQAAATALASTTSVELNRRLLERIDWRRPTARITLWLVGLSVVLAAAVIFFFDRMVPRIGTESAGFMFFGLLLLLVPTGMLLGRLKDGRLRWASIRGALALVSFWMTAVVVLPYVHGLAHALIRRWKLACGLLGLELLGLFLFVFVAKWSDVPDWGGSVSDFYRLVGSILFVGTYLYDVLGVALQVFVLRQAQATEERRSTIYRAVFRNATMADTVFADLRSAIKQEIHRSRKLLRHFGASIAPAKLLEMFVAADPLYERHLIRALKKAKNDDVVSDLEALWGKVNRQRRRSVITILARKPTESSVKALKRIGSSDGVALKIRAAIAGLHFKVSVWSWPARLAALSALPFVFVLGYHAMMVRQNPAWAQIVLLRQPLTQPAQQVKIVRFLADAYPGGSVDALRDLFQEGASGDVTAVHAAIARGLVTIHDSLPYDTTYKPRVDLASDLDHVRTDLYAQMSRFTALLSDSADATFYRGLGVLGAMAAAADSGLSKAAVAHLVAFAGTGAMSQPKYQVIDVLGRMHYARAIPALDRLVKRRQAQRQQWDTDIRANVAIRHRIDSLAWSAYRSIPKRTKESAALLTMLEPLAYPPAALMAQLRLDLAAPCDRNGDGTCDDKDEVLEVIASRPGSEEGYISLFLRYGADEYGAAATTFAQLVTKYPRSIWPRRFLMMIYHEYLAKDDPSAFETSYQYMVGARRLDAFRRLEASHGPDYVRLQSDFVEVALTAGRYDETERWGRALLRGEALSTTRYNMTLFLYLSSVMQRQTDSASVRLDELETVVRSLPSDFYTNWIYDGTLLFIERSDLPSELKAALSAFCKEGDWYSQKEALAVVDQNRSALRLLAPQGVR